MAEGNYEVGYGKPPKSGQFQKGTSGNAGGQRKRRESNKEIVERLLDRVVPFKQDGETLRLAVREIMFTKLVEKATNGCPKAQKQVFEILKDDSQTTPKVDESALGVIALRQVATLRMEDNDPGPGGIPYVETCGGEIIDFDTVLVPDPSGIGPGSIHWVLPARLVELLGLVFDPAQTSDLVTVKWPGPPR